jgi:hypothetical protein
MKTSRKWFVALAAGLAMLAAAASGCGRQLVAPQGQTAALVFADRDTLAKFQQQAKDRGIMGAVGALGPSSNVKPLVNGTRVKVLAEDNDTAEILVTRGPYKGLHGYVLKTAVK